MPGQSDFRLAIAATRGVGGAVERNRHRRKLKEFYRLNKSLWPAGFHIFILVRTPITDWISFEQRFQKLLAEIA